jgi:hypothetical protein
MSLLTVVKVTFSGDTREIGIEVAQNQQANIHFSKESKQIKIKLRGLSPRANYTD